MASLKSSPGPDPSPRQRVLIVLDGAGDRYRRDGLSPLDIARSEGLDFVAREGYCGRMQTLYSDLARGSLVAHLGMLGWDPRLYFPHGRSSCELLALEGATLDEGDLTFRANFVYLTGKVLASYNANAIESDGALPLVQRIERELFEQFPDFELHHNLDFRNSLVIRGAGVDPRELLCLEPHENQGDEIDLEHIVTGTSEPARQLAARLNRYVAEVARLLEGEAANAIVPWSPASPLLLPPFASHTGFTGSVAVIAAMDFLHGLARQGEMAFYRVGNGRVDTDFEAKGKTTLELLEQGTEFVVCHVNAPDEAAHMGDVEAKIHCIEEIDRHVVMPVLSYFERHPERLGAVAVMPDHYTNVLAGQSDTRRYEAHSIDPVPFAVWDGERRDGVERYGEDAVLSGLYGAAPLSHLDLLKLLGVAREPVPS